MTGFAVHLRQRWLASLLRPQGLILTLLAALASLLVWPLLVSPLESAGVAGSVVFLLTCVVMLPLLMLAPVTGVSISGCFRPQATQRPAPALPVGLRARILAEALAATLALLVARLAWLPAAALAGVDLRSIFGSFADTWPVGALVTLPALVAWNSAGRTAAKPLVVSVLLVGAAQGGLLASPAGAAAVALPLTAVLLWLADREPPRRRRPAALRRPAVTARASMGSPAEQLRHDLWLGPLKRYGLIWVAAPVVALGMPLLGGEERLPETLVAVIYGALYGFLLLGLFAPFGLSVAGLDRGTGRGMDGAYLRAWSRLPVSPRAVARGVWLHVMAWGGASFLLLLANWGTGFQMGLETLRGLGYLLPLALGVPALAGLLLCKVVGDRVRGAASLFGFVLFLTSHLIIYLAMELAGVTIGEGPRIAIRASTTTAFGLIAALPPLVHLRRPPAAPGEYHD